MFLTIVYTTSRKNPRFKWFVDSLAKQIKPEDKIKVIIVDRFYPYHPSSVSRIYCFERYRDFNREFPIEWLVVSPKPCVWQGEHRLTKEDWFAASSSRNTGLCLAQDGFIAFVDDLSVLLPSWLQSVREAMAQNYLVCGSYQKVKNLFVEDGLVKSFDYYDRGIDNRRSQAFQEITPCSGDWLYGCSCAMPVEALLTIGGWAEPCDGLGFEDVCTGIILNNAGFGFRYDKRMMTYEDEDAHFEEPAMKKTDKGQSPLDKSHAILNIVKSGQKYFDSQYEGGIRAERKRVLNGEPFTIRKHPDRDWYDGQLISEM
jgi:hypothetical protein